MPLRPAESAISRPSKPGRPIRSRAATMFVLAGTALLVAGCDSGPTNQFAPPAPSVVLVPDASDLTRFNDRGQDVTDMEVGARLTAVKGATTPGDTRRQADAKIQVAMTLTRGPALVGRTVSVPYMVTVAQGDRIIDQKDYTVTTTFARAVDQVSVTDQPIAMVFPVTQQKTSAAYTIYVSFRLTPQQLAYNRAHPQAVQ
jgi:hypothetical protein